MHNLRTTASLIAAATFALAAAWPAMAQSATETEVAEETIGIADIIVTAQRRETTVQDTAAAISAFGGESLENARVLSFEDLAGAATSLSFTALTPLDQEFNIRGITNTRLDSPSADQSIGIFVDDAYVGRSGLFNFDLYDIDRIEVVRGPQGVLLGRNVVGGAINVLTAQPQDEIGGSLNLSYGNFDEKLAKGHLTGQLAGALSGRVAFQYRKRDGFNQDILHDVDLDNVDSKQFRVSLKLEPDEGDFVGRLVFDYTNDESNGFHSVALDGPGAGSGPWSAARARIGAIRGKPLGIRESLPEWPQYKGDAAPSPQRLEREAYGINLRLDKGIGVIGTLSSITGVRHGEAFNLYDQTGIGPFNGFGVISPTLFHFPVNETEEITTFSQELRIVSPDRPDGGLEYIIGAYFQHDDVSKFDKFFAEVPAPIATLSGESHWDNDANNDNVAVFGQLAYRFSEMFKFTAGVRYSKDTKKGFVKAFAIEGGDRFNPNDQVALTPLASTFREGGGFATPYKNSWSEITPQATVEFTPNDDMLFYATYATGYKGGGFEDTPANEVAAQSGYDPETVDNYEVGAKVDFFDRRARVNIAAFKMRYKNLQVTQTSAACLCNITDNAADAKIKGIEVEATVQPLRGLSLNGGLTYLDTEYINFIDSLRNDNSGNFLQRTPKYQWNIGADFVAPLFGNGRGFQANVNYNRQGKLFWAPDNRQTEKPYGTLGARVSISPTPNLTLSAWGRNLTNEIYRTNIIAFFGDEVSRLGAPRQYGGEISFKF